jgi:hypothetical protein
MLLDPKIPHYPDDLLFAANFGQLVSGAPYKQKKLDESEALVLFNTGCEKFSKYKPNFLKSMTNMSSLMMNVERFSNKFYKIVSLLVKLPQENLNEKTFKIFLDVLNLNWKMFHEYYPSIVRMLSYIAMQFPTSLISKLDNLTLSNLKEMALELDDYDCGHPKHLNCTNKRRLDVCESYVYFHTANGFAKTILHRYSNKSEYPDATVIGLSVRILSRAIVLGEVDEEMMNEYYERQGVRKETAKQEYMIADYRLVCNNKTCYKVETDKCFSRCGRCKIVEYCSRECQIKDWSLHKKSCK